MKILIKDIEILYNSVNYEDVWRKREKKCEKLKRKLLFYHFTLEISDRGDLFSIPCTAYFGKFLPNSVNHDQD